MAKKAVTNTTPFLFSSLCKELTKINPESSILKSNPYAKITDWVGLGNYLLNAQVTGSLFKGIPEGRVTMVAGQSGCLPEDEIVDCYIMKTLDKSREIIFE